VIWVVIGALEKWKYNIAINILRAMSYQSGKRFC